MQPRPQRLGPQYKPTTFDNANSQLNIILREQPKNPIS